MRSLIIICAILFTVQNVSTLPKGLTVSNPAPVLTPAVNNATKLNLSVTPPPPQLRSSASSSSVSTNAASSDTTSCTYRRQMETNSNTRLPGRLIPECRPDGKFASLQCHGEAVGGGRFCQCWDPEGNIIRAPSKKVKACDCILQRHQMTSERPRRIGAFVPQCEESGHFKKHQCHGSVGLCWCVHPTNGTQIGEKTRGLAAESCA